MPSTFCPSQVTVSATVVSPSSLGLASPATSTSTPPSAGTTTGLVNLQPKLTTSAPGNQVDTARAASAIVYMPCAITPGSPTLARDRLVLVDRVVVAAGLGVADQVGAGDREGLRLERHALAPRWTRVALVEQTRAPDASVISLVVPMMSLPRDLAQAR